MDFHRLGGTVSAKGKFRPASSMKMTRHGISGEQCRKTLFQISSDIGGTVSAKGKSHASSMKKHGLGKPLYL